jgi:hypothetical protein
VRSPGFEPGRQCDRMMSQNRLYLIDRVVTSLNFAPEQVNPCLKRYSHQLYKFRHLLRVSVLGAPYKSLRYQRTDAC